ncbi:hypothetical protein LIER_14878 [Lithospermum erythrorhizon]|uniref:Uncharacterized protein n=1 Tax=Lithospermum erythrorhizon TaxID=34254 RepID=A0AAV3Q5B5_LITER
MVARWAVFKGVARDFAVRCEMFRGVGKRLQFGYWKMIKGRGVQVRWFGLRFEVELVEGRRHLTRRGAAMFSGGGPTVAWGGGENRKRREG